MKDMSYLLGHTKYYKASKPVTHDELLAILHYDPESGIFTWKVNANSFTRAGDIAGKKCKGDYCVISIKAKYYPRSHLAWFYQTGKWPEKFIDHINLDKHDDRFANLREATCSQNNANAGPRRNNTSGYKGVFWHKQVGRYRAQIKVRHKVIHLGLFDDPREASLAYAEAAKLHFGEFGRAI